VSALLLGNLLPVAWQPHLLTGQLATTDGLTGVLNRAEFLSLGKGEMELAERLDEVLVVLMLDVDHFKAINDNHGHAGGDLALQHFVALMRVETRQTDLLGRMGGEEFAIILPATSPSAAEQVAERLRCRVARLDHFQADCTS